MISETLSLIDPALKISVLRENAQYGFQVKWVNLPNEKCQLLFTDGLAKNVQQVKDGFEAFKKIELYFCLPDYWNLNENKWPIDWIERLGAVPQKNDTWFGPGDTIPAGNPPEIISDRFEANHFMLTEPISLAHFFENSFGTDFEVKMLGIIPICQEELDYKIRNSATVLTEKLKHANHSEKVDLFRTTVCRKRFLGFI